jgi:hypothetical protein
MRSFRLVSGTAIAFVIASTMAQAAPTSHREHNVVPPTSQQYASADHAYGMPTTAPYARSELWPSCQIGTEACTAAGYPNLHYYRELQGLSY